MEQNSRLNRQWMTILTMACFIILLSLARTSYGAGIDASVDNVNNILALAVTAVAQGNYEETKGQLAATARNLEKSASWAHFIWAERQDNPGYVPATLNPLPQELTEKYYDDMMTSTKADYEALLKKIEEAQYQLGIQKLKTMTSMLSGAASLGKGIVDTIKGNPLMAPKTLLDLQKKVQEDVIYIEKHLISLESAKLLPKRLTNLKKNVVKLAQEIRKVRDSIIILGPELKRIKTAMPMALNAIQQGMDIPLPPGPKTVFDSTPFKTEITTVENGLEIAQLPWESGIVILDEIYIHAQTAYNAIAVPTPEDTTAWSNFDNEYNTKKSSLTAPRNDHIQQLTALGDAWRGALITILNQFMAISFGSPVPLEDCSAHNPIAPSLELDSTDSRAWKTDYETMLSAPTGPAIVPAQAGSFENDWHEYAINYPSRLSDLLDTYTRAWQSAYASMAYADWEALNNTVDTRQPYQIFALKRQSLNILLENLNAIRSEAVRFSGSVSAAKGIVWDLAGLQSKADAYRQFLADHAGTVPETEFDEYITVTESDVANISQRLLLAADGISVLETEAVISYLEREANQFDFEAQEMIEQATEIGNKADIIAFDINRMLTFNDSLASKQPAAREMLDYKFDDGTDVFLGKGDHGYLFDSLEILDNALWQHVDTWYSHNNPPDILTHILPHMDLIRSCGSSALNRFAWLTEQIWSVTDNLTFATLNIKPNPSTRGTGFDAGDNYLILSENKALADQFTSVRFLRYHMRPYTDPMGYITLDQIRLGLPKVKAWLDANTGTGYSDLTLQKVTATPFKIPVSNTLLTPMTIRVVDSADNPVTGVPVTLDYDTDTLHGVAMQSTDTNGVAKFYPGPYPEVGSRTITFSIAGAFPLNVLIEVVTDTDGDGCGDDWEIAYNFNPTEAFDGEGDFDGDRLTNRQEQALGSNPLLSDTDEDGFTDLAEMNAGSDPADPQGLPLPKTSPLPVPPAMRLGTDWEKTSDYIGVTTLMEYAYKFTRLISFKDRIWAFGNSEVWSSENGIQWTKHPDSPEWAPRSAFTVAVHNNRLWVTGGTASTGSGTHYHSDVWVSDDGIHWSQVNGAAQFGPRTNAHLLSMGENLWLTGGNRYDPQTKAFEEQNDVWKSEDGIHWTQVTASAPWPLRRSSGFSSVVFDNKLWIMGGDISVHDNQTGLTSWTTFQDVWNSVDGVSWTQVTDAPAWRARYGASLVTLNEKMWLFGGTTHTPNVYMPLTEAWVSENGIDWKAAKGPSSNQAQAFIFKNDLWVYNDRVSNFSGYTNNRLWRSRGPVLEEINHNPYPATANPTAFSAGAGHVLAIAANGTLWTWGENHAGQLGDGTTSPRTKPVQIGTDSDWQAVTAGMNFSMALKSNGSLWGWGQNYYGQIGNGSTADQTTPVQIGTDTDWETMATGQNHSLAIKTDGSLWAWGLNNGGQLGDGTTENRTMPVQIGTDADWTRISAGSTHSLALKKDGSVWIWGNNYYGQLGTGTATELLIPSQGNEVEWSALNVDKISISAGSVFTAALGSDGLLHLWGDNSNGQIGVGESQSFYAKALSITPFDVWLAVSGGSFHTAAIKQDNSLWAWGSITSFQPTDITYVPNNLPVPIGSDTDWISVSSGGNFCVAQKADRSLWAWGANGYGQLGNGTNTSNNTPARILSLGPTAADTDGDWMDDTWEIKHFSDTTRDGTGDFDADGLTDFLEFQINTLPDNKDSDQDGMPDKWEIDLNLNPLVNDDQQDADHDGLTNLEEYEMVVYRYTSDGGIAAMAASKNFLYVIDGQTGILDIIDTTNPKSPSRVATYSTRFQNVFGLKIKNTKACVANAGVFHLIDVTDPTSPQSLGTYPSGENHIQGFDISDSILAFADAGGNLQVIDIHDPSTPVHMGTYDNNGKGCLGEVIISGPRVFTTRCSSSVQIVDISDPTTPFMAGEYTAELVWPPSIAVSGDLLYAATRPGWGGDGENELRIINTTDPAHSQKIRSYPGFLEGLALSGKLAGALINDSVDLVDVSNPILPERLADIDNIADTRISEILIDQDLLYARYGFGTDTRVALVDISRFSRRFITAEPGDINHSRAIDTTDALLALKVLAGIFSREHVYLDGDVNNDQKLGIAEAINALQKTAEF